MAAQLNQARVIAVNGMYSGHFKEKDASLTVT